MRYLVLERTVLESRAMLHTSVTTESKEPVHTAEQGDSASSSSACFEVDIFVDMLDVRGSKSEG